MSKIISAIYSVLMAIILFFQSLFGLAPESKIKNVILFIGDGMGFMSIEKTRVETGESLALDTFEVKSESQTASANSSVTDSAAGATALACGVKTNNSCVGVYPDDVYAKNSYPMNLTEFANANGMKTGVVTTDSTKGATPAGFSAHTDDRGNKYAITDQQIASNIDLIWGEETSSCKKSEVESAGFAYITDLESMSALEEGSRSFGQFTDSLWHSTNENGMPTLEQMTNKAIDLLDDDEDGFFLMVEGAHIDKNSHSNNGEGMKEALLSFDAAVEAALDYAKKDKHTLVIVTADHETGGITLENGKYVYTTGGHTGVNVPLLVYGSDDFVKEGETSMQNTEIPRRIVEALKKEGFPATVTVAAN